MISILQPCLIAALAQKAQKETGSLVLSESEIHQTLHDFIQPYSSTLCPEEWLDVATINTHMELLSADIHNPSLIVIEEIQPGSQGNPATGRLWSIQYVARFMSLGDLVVNLFSDVDYSGTLGAPCGLKVTSRSWLVLEKILFKGLSSYLSEARTSPYPLISALIAGSLQGAIQRKEKLCDEDSYYIDLTAIERYLKKQEDHPNLNLLNAPLKEGDLP